MRPGAADLAGGPRTRRQSGRSRGAGTVSWSHHRSRPSRRRRPPPPASKPPPRARPRSALSLRWRPPLGPWRSTSRSWFSTRPQTSNSKVGRNKAAPDWSGAGGGLDLGRAVGVEGMLAAGARVSVPSPTPQDFHSPAAPRFGPRPACPAPGPAPSRARSHSVRAPAPGRRRGPALAPPPPSCGPAGAPPAAARAAARAWHLSLAPEGRRALSGRAWVGGDLRACVLVCGGERKLWGWRKYVRRSHPLSEAVGGRQGSGAAALGLGSERTTPWPPLPLFAWVEPVLGPRQGCRSLAFCPVYKLAFGYFER